MDGFNKKQAGAIASVVVISFAVAGYFTGLQSPMNPSSAPSPVADVPGDRPMEISDKSDVVPATGYESISNVVNRHNDEWLTRLTSLKSTVDPLAPVIIEPGDKLIALQKRAQNRAFNGAPPAIPHPAENESGLSCVACHQNGMRTDSLRIPAMSHPYLANCTQCHVESRPRHMEAYVFKENSFSGLKAPTDGPRAFPGAPPQMPHATWMRQDCNSCHGTTGLHGIRSTHPWRQSCQQCHTPAAREQQIQLATQPQFLSGPVIEDKEDE